jgi:hypothetical protein
MECLGQNMKGTLIQLQRTFCNWNWEYTEASAEVQSHSFQNVAPN